VIVVIDNITLVKVCKPPNALLKANSGPFEYSGIIYYPKFEHGVVSRYDGQLKNLRLFWYPQKVIICNSIHKYCRGNNFSNFHLSEMQASVEKLSEDTGIQWEDAAVKKLEYGCNLEANAEIIYQSLLSYKGKDYLPMKYNGKVYGADCEFNEYKIKAYDKTFQVKEVERQNLNYSLFRWEVVLKQKKGIGRIVQPSLEVKHLLLPETWQVLANDAVTKFENSIKLQQLYLHKLSTHELRVFATMLNPLIRDEFERHHKDVYKRDRGIYRRFMRDKTICIADNAAEQLRAKFRQLINDRGIL
jgi:hypothetical protein